MPIRPVKTIPLVSSILLFLAGLLIFSEPASLKGQSANVALSAVSDTGNAPDPLTGYGEVDYNYCIGTSNVTNAQYCAFLNAVAATDTYRLYNSGMAAAGNFSGNATGAGIVRSGLFGSYTYSVIGTSGNEPVTYVSWLDAARFCNWMQNGQPATGVEEASTTEKGAYTLNGDTDVSAGTGLSGTSGQETRNPGATWWIPSENEWYKAAYYDPTLNSGAGGYWLYATQSNATPGNATGSGSNEANYLYNNGSQYVFSVKSGQSYSATQDYLTPAGAFTSSTSYYGTYDQSGNVYQWNEAIMHVNARGLRGGSWYSGLGALGSPSRTLGGPAGETYDIGFRVASSTTPPTILGNGVISVTGTDAVLTGTVNSNGTDTKVYFLYGTSTQYDGETAVQDIGSGPDDVAVSATISGLTSATLYHYSIVAATSVGNATQSADATFTSGPQFDIALTEVDDAGNSPDPLTGYGEVDYPYAIGTYDITEAQYCSFLNAVATTADPYGLYNSNLLNTICNVGGIMRSGNSGNYSYAVIGNSGNDPITYVTWLDAARFCNWLQNGQPATGVEDPTTTEEGAYTLDGDMTKGLEIENAGATWWIPSEDQWYKAAYYDPTLGGYWLYPTQSDSAPGNQVGGGVNEANYYSGSRYSVTQSGTYTRSQNYLTSVGAFADSASYYGTYDQGGDVYQWNDAIINGNARGMRGGSWDSANSYALKSSNRVSATATHANAGLGFRVATGAMAYAAPNVLASGIAYVTGSTAILTGTVNAAGADTTVYFQYGTDPSYGSQTDPQDIGSGFGNIAVTGTLSDLTPLTVYYYQAVAVSSNGTTYGAPETFNTTPPEAVNDSVTLTGASPVTIQPLANDSDPNGFPLTITAISQPSLGNAVLSVDGTTVTYTPNMSFSAFAGTDKFTYTISNGNGGTATAEIIIGNPYYLQKGVFAGALNTIGGGYVTLATTANGAFTGKLRVGTATYVLKGNFAADGSYNATVDGAPLTLQFDTTDLAGEAFGQYQITGSYNGNSITAYHALYNSITNPAPEVGTYMVLLPAASSTNPLIPSGSGYATVTVNENGTVTITGALADGTGFSDGVVITGGADPYADGFPIYTPLGYKVPGSLTGAIKFQDVPAVSGTGGTDCDGTVKWVKPAQTRTTFYPSGFTTTLSAEGSRYAEPPFGTLALGVSGSDPNATITLTEPDFLAPITHQLLITPGATIRTDNVAVTNAGADSLSISISAYGGSFTGSFIQPLTGKKVTLKGAILYKQSEAAGFFISPTQSGNATILPP